MTICKSLGHFTGTNSLRILRLKYLLSCDSVWGNQGMKLEIDNGAKNPA